jgi:hypothetical protein
MAHRASLAMLPDTPTRAQLGGEPALLGALGAEVHPQAAPQDLEAHHVPRAVALVQRRRILHVLLRAQRGQWSVGVRMAGGA